jgi:hypothetical protein
MKNQMRDYQELVKTLVSVQDRIFVPLDEGELRKLFFVGFSLPSS